MTFQYHSPFPLRKDETPFRKLDCGGVRLERFGSREFLVVEREAIRALSEAAMIDINHLLRPAPSRAARKNPRRSRSDRQRQIRRLRSSEERQYRRRRRAADVPGYRHRDRHGQEGPAGLHRGRRRGAIAEGIRDAYEKKNLRYSQLAPLSMFEEKNTANNLPAQIDIYAEGEDAYKFLFIAKGGGSANKTYLFQGDALDPDPRSADRRS